MKIYTLKIKKIFLESIRSGRKTHEYRLGTPDRMCINVGDVLVLINNQDKNDFEKVVVNSKTIYNSWDDALSLSWESDFPSFSSIEGIKKECFKFYAKNEVDSFGIISFEISKYKKDPKNSNVLLDTNIVIHRESSNNISYEVVQLYKLLESLKTNKFLLSDINEELSKYKDHNTQNMMLNKIKAYNIIDSGQINDSQFIEKLSSYAKDNNSIIDDKYLYQVYCGKVDFLITDDKGIIRKAKDLFLDDSVFSSSDYLRLIEKEYPSLIDYPVLSVKLKRFSDINIDDSFFDTLREDYKGIKFNNWFLNKNSENAYVFSNNEGLQGFLYLKIENEKEKYNDIKPPFKPKKRLKVGTFKINSTGLRVGERFIKIIIDYALKSDVDEIYVTMFENKRSEVKLLMSLMMKWGFSRWGYKSQEDPNDEKEVVLVKNMRTFLPEKDPKFNYPFFNRNANISFLPIEARWHRDLFPDLFLKNEDMSLLIERPCSYAVEKIYVCAWIPNSIKIGDVLVIYRMSGIGPKKYHSVASGYCIVQDIIHPLNYEQFINECNNKSVFSEQELLELYNNRKSCILKILYSQALDKKINYNDMVSNGIFDKDSGPRLSTIISFENFEKLKQLGKED